MAKRKVNEKFKKNFPKLNKELEEGGALKVDAVKGKRGEAERIVPDLQGYEPTVVDYLRRCRTDDEGVEIVNYVEKKGDITAEYAKELRHRILKHGVRSFGKLIEAGHYERGEI